jgi:hypothetical protein
MSALPVLSLCVGVTGHIDIDPAAVPRVRELVAQAPTGWSRRLAWRATGRQS